MSQPHFVASPMSRKQIRAFALFIRNLFNVPDDENIDIFRLIEYGLPEIFKDFSLRIIPKDKMYEYAFFLPEKNELWIREDVYEAALNGNPRHRFTLAHEIGHVFLHQNIKRLARGEFAVSIPAYKDPEWQANEFAGELLAPAHLIGTLSQNEIMLRFNLSSEAAKHRYNNSKK
ncbi:ImmA/IrrE family metallo-endopeptidase [Exiguobacterium acetylicum]|uniref:ImmA/IrrE family metallo-endopeptidase n=1 Tax=Exiguobacterium acetylicum TaxID=41170 RepID=UPI001EE29890|nr:ImmA/IrrE family metallo-endopeptidase [Exiguobacterium acetylicum]UKS54910.1 ImmA/IrrE family metallo-endopeptidase [Exiguobacterium acetylicum]